MVAWNINASSSIHVLRETGSSMFLLSIMQPHLLSQGRALPFISWELKFVALSTAAPSGVGHFASGKLQGKGWGWEAGMWLWQGYHPLYPNGKVRKK